MTDYYRPKDNESGPITTLVNMVERLSSEVQFKIVISDRDFVISNGSQDYALLKQNEELFLTALTENRIVFPDPNNSGL